MSAPLYPVGLRLDGRPVLMVGAGAVAVGKVAGLLECGARVTVVAPDVAPEIAAREVEVWQRPFAAGDTDGFVLVVTATDDSDVNRAVSLEATAAGIWVNSADDPANCTFTLPARVRVGDLLVTVSTNGRSPALSSWMRRQFDDDLGPEYATLLDLLAEARDQARAEGVTIDPMSWQRALDSGMLEAIRHGHFEDAKETLRACLS